MKLKLTSLALLLSASLSTQAATIAQWTFETNPPSDSNNSGTGPSVGADIGSGNVFGVHASSQTDWSTPSGNGSANSFSVNTWATGDYWQFELSTSGYQDIFLNWQQTSSGTGPRNFKLLYSTTGGSFADFSAYLVLENASANGGTWGATYRPNYSISMDLSGVAEIENASNVYFRLVNDSTTSANGGTVAAGGSSRIDNFTVSGTEIKPSSISVPDAGSSLLLLGFALGGVIGSFRWSTSARSRFCL